jgi:hypothetical protein
VVVRKDRGTLLVLKIFTSLPAIKAEFPSICFTDVFGTLHWHVLAIRLLDFIRLHIPEILEQTFNTVREAASGNTEILQLVSFTSSSINSVLKHSVLQSTTLFTDIKIISSSLMKQV